MLRGQNQDPVRRQPLLQLQTVYQRAQEFPQLQHLVSCLKIGVDLDEHDSRIGSLFPFQIPPGRCSPLQ